MLKRDFLKGRMNKDADERLLPQGEVRDFLNCRVNNSEGSDVGSIENCLGNEIIVDLGLTNSKTIGVKEDDKNEMIYWFVVSNEKEGIVEWNKNTNQVLWVLEEAPGTVLNLNNGHLINFINLVYADENIGVLLFWVQEDNPPRMANIERAKTTYGLNGFIEEDISVIKKPPTDAPIAQLTYTETALENNLEKKILTFGYRYKYLDEMYSAISFFTEYQFGPNEFDLNYETLENEGMLNSFNAVNLIFNTGSKRVVGIDLLVKESNSNVPYIIESLDKEHEGWGNDELQEFEFSNNKTYQALSEIQLYRLYDNVPVLANVQEFIGNRLSYYDYYEGYNMIDCKEDKVVVDYTVDYVTKSIIGEVIETELEPDSRIVDGNTVIISDGVVSIDFNEVDLIKGNSLTFDVRLENTQSYTGSYSNTFQFILNRDYLDAEDLAISSEFIIFVETFWQNNFENNYDLVNPPEDSYVVEGGSFEILSYTSSQIKIRAPYVRFAQDEEVTDPVTDETTTVTTYTNVFFNYNDSTEFYISETGLSKSVKSNRDLEIGVVYYDDNNRCTTVLTSKENTVYIPHSKAENQNKLIVNLNNKPPCWATKYKFVVKQNKFGYENIFANVFYEEGLYRWVLLEGSNKDKVKEGDVLIVKTDLDGFVPELIKTTVLEVALKNKDFLEDNEDSNDEDIIEQQGLYMKIRPNGFNMNYTEDQFINIYQYKKSSSTKPTVYLGEFSALVDEANNTWEDIVINSGSKIDIRINNYESDGDQFLYDKSFIVQDNYDNFQDWFEAEVNELGDFNTYSFERGFYNYSDFGSGFTPDPAGALYLRVKGNLSGTQFERSKLKGTINIRLSFGVIIFETEPTLIDEGIFYEGPDTFFIENEVHLGNNQTQDLIEQNSGPLEIGEYYTINDLIDGDDFENVGATNTIGETFIATGTTPTAWTNNSILTQPTVSTLNFFNCFVQGNGVESYKILDGFNTKYLNIDTRPNTTSLTDFKRVHRYASVTNSEPFEESSNLNGLNEFNLARVNYKDLEKKYGAIKNAFYRDDNILIAQEDKWGYILYQKDIITTAEGASSVVAIDGILGRYVPYTGEYGISRSPESFAYFGTRIYGVDPKRGTPLRLSVDGINEINYGVIDFFKDLFRNNTYITYEAAYDPYFDEYILVINNKEESFTIGFAEKGYSEDGRGWTSRYSFVPEKMIGMNNQFYSFKNGNLWLHNSENVPRNNFYGVQYTSKIKTIINDIAQEDKIFKTLVLEGTDAWGVKVATNYSNSSIDVFEFKNRESRWVSYIRKNEDNNDLNGNSAQGIGVIQEINGLDISFNSISGIVSIGDELYFVDGNSNNQLIGVITNIVPGKITVDAINNTPTIGFYSFAKKPSRIEGSEIRGYYMEVELENNSTSFVELFSIGTNAVKSTYGIF